MSIALHGGSAVSGVCVAPVQTCFDVRLAYGYYVMSFLRTFLSAITTPKTARKSLTTSEYEYRTESETSQPEYVAE